MSDDERIAQLEAEVSQLRADAEKADAAIALVLGIALGMHGTRLTVDANSMLKAASIGGWQSTVIERLTEGQELVKRALDAH